MKTAIWRYLHLGLALSISTLLIIASVTGGILALDEMIKNLNIKHTNSLLTFPFLMPLKTLNLLSLKYKN